MGINKKASIYAFIKIVLPGIIITGIILGFCILVAYQISKIDFAKDIGTFIGEVQKYSEEAKRNNK